MKIEAQATHTTPAHEVTRHAAAVMQAAQPEPPRDLTVDGLLKLVDKLERAHKTQAEIAWQHYQRAQAAEAALEAARQCIEADDVIGAHGVLVTALGGQA